MNNQRLLRIPQVEDLTALKRAHIYALARRGQFPRPIKIGARASAWLEVDVRAWIAARLEQAQERSA